MTAWKDSEKKWAETLQKYLVPAFRKNRMGNYSISDDDVGVEGHDWLISDSKHSIHGWEENRALRAKVTGIKKQYARKLLEATEAKYAEELTDQVVLVSHGHREIGQVCSVDSEFMAMLLSYWMGFATREQLMDIYSVNTRPRCKKTKTKEKKK